MDTQAARLVHSLEQFVDAADARERLEQVRFVQSVVREFLERENGRAVRILVAQGRLGTSRINDTIAHIRLGLTYTADVPPRGEWYVGGISGAAPRQ